MATMCECLYDEGDLTFYDDGTILVRDERGIIKEINEKEVRYFFNVMEEHFNSKENKND